MLMNIEAERARKGMTKERISNVLGITQTTYNNYISESTPIPSDILLKMGQCFGTSIDYLLGLTPAK